MKIDVDSLKKELAVKEPQLKQLDKQLTNLERTLTRLPEYIALAKAYKESDRKERIFRKKLDTLEKNIRLEFTDDGDYPHYCRSESWRMDQGTNILPEVFGAISQEIDYTKLKDDQVRHIVNSLIGRERQKHIEDLSFLDTQIKKLCSEQTEIYEKQQEIEKKHTGVLRDERYWLAREIGELNDKIAHPRKYEERERKAEERAKATASWNITAIYKHYGVIRANSKKEAKNNE